MKDIRLLLFLGLALLAQSGAQSSPEKVGPINCAALAVRAPIDGAHWLSLPMSRLVLYPNFGQDADNDTTGPAGALPVQAAYYVGAGPVLLPDLWHVEGDESHFVSGPRLNLTPSTWQAQDVTAVFSDASVQLATTRADFGAITQTVTVDLGATPDLVFQTPQDSADWAVKVNDGSLPVDIALKPALWRGMRVADVAAATGWRGVKAFQVRLFEVGRGQSITFSHLQFARLIGLPRGASQEALWRPDQMTTRGGDGFSSTVILPNADSVAEQIHVVRGAPGKVILSGQFSGQVDWDVARHVLWLRGRQFTVALAVSCPAKWLGVRVSVLDWESLSGLSDAASGGVWRLLLDCPPGANVVVTARFAPAPLAPNVLADAARRQASRAVFAAALVQDEANWNKRLARVPQPEGFTPRHVASLGLTAAQIRRSYFNAWAALWMDTLPPMPENGYLYPQVCTGKAALWTDGPTHAPETATWDSLVAMQALALADPMTCERAMTGELSLVGADGYLNGESLPSVFAQTLWTLFTQTGDKAWLRAAYPALKRHLLWMITNPRWIYPNRAEPAPDPNAPKDQEFVTYEIVDMGYAAQIAQALGRPDEAASWRGRQQQALADYGRWFWPTPGGPVYRIYSSQGGASDPDDPWSLQGLALGPRLLSPDEQAGLLSLYQRSRNLRLPFLLPGRTRFGDLRPIVLGLFRCGRPDWAAQLADACMRDVTRAGEFSEDYAQTDPPQAQGVRPSCFGACLMIGSVLWHNGSEKAFFSP